MRGESNEQTTEFSLEVKQRAVRMVLEGQGEHDSQWAAIRLVAGKMGCTPETLRRWVRQIEVNEGKRAGVTTVEARRTTSTGNPPLSGGMPRAAAPA